MIYVGVGVLSLIGLIIHSRKNLIGSLIVATLWPILVPGWGFFMVKKHVFGRRGPSKTHFEMEVAAIAVATIAIALYLRTNYDLSWMYAWPKSL